MPKRILPHDHGERLDGLLARLPEAESFDLVANLFKEVSDSKRVRIFWVLCHCEECVINLSVMMDMSAPALSHHLARLRAAGLITSRREGKEVYYRAGDGRAAQLLHRLIEDTLEMACPDWLHAPAEDGQTPGD